MLDVILYVTGLALLMVSPRLAAFVWAASFFVGGWFLEGGDSWAAFALLALAALSWYSTARTTSVKDLVRMREAAREFVSEELLEQALAIAAPVVAGLVISAARPGTLRAEPAPLAGPGSSFARQAYSLTQSLWELAFSAQVWMVKYAVVVALVVYGCYRATGLLLSLSYSWAKSAGPRLRAPRPSPPQRPGKSSRKTEAPSPQPPQVDVLVDGSNVVWHKGPSLSNLAMVVRELEARGLRWHVVFDASLKHRVADQQVSPEDAEVLTGERAEMRGRDLVLKMVQLGRADEAPAGRKADDFIVELSRRWGSMIVTNDALREYAERDPSVLQRRITFMITRGTVIFDPEPMPGKGAGEGEKGPSYFG
ncbi:MAG: hypothetical protein QXW56_09235 [Nitrososphaerota archaeon]